MELDIKRMMPDAWPIFFHHRKLLPIQMKAIPYVLRGQNILISSPTASGKTEAVLAPLYQRHISFRRKKLSVVYVAPTKALVNDLYYRIVDYLEGGGQHSRVHRYTGDHHDFRGSEDAFILTVTPEALDSIQLTKPELLRGIRAVVIDEIHFLHGNPRGQQLRHVIDRLKVMAETPLSPRDVFQLIGTSATIDDINYVRRVWLGDDSLYVADGQQRNIEMNFQEIPDKRLSISAFEVASILKERIINENILKVLIFANSRNNAHLLSIALSEEFKKTKYQVFLHFGILAASERDRIENEIKTRKTGICVATSTLEIGIDIGDIDLVVLLSPPISINSFLQRIGRGNRRTNITKVLALHRNELERNVYAAVLSLAKQGILDEVHEYDRPSVRFQQILSLSWKGIRSGNPLKKDNLGLYCTNLSHMPVISDMIDSGHLKNIGGCLIPSDKLMDEGDKRRIHTVISTQSSKEVIDAKTGEILAHISNFQRNGLVFIGGHIKFAEFVEGDKIVLEDTHSRTKNRIVEIPAIRHKWGLPRMLVWEIAKTIGKNPKIWEREETQIKTWGGLENNRLLALLCRLQGAVNSVGNDFGVDKLPVDFELAPANIIDWVQDGIIKKISYKDAYFFKQPSEYFNMLSNNLKKEEIMNSLPIKKFMNWLKECLGDK